MCVWMVGRVLFHVWMRGPQSGDAVKPEPEPFNIDDFEIELISKTVLHTQEDGAIMGVLAAARES